MGKIISKNYEQGDLIDDPITIMQLAHKKKSIYVTVWKRTSPASVIFHMQFSLVVDWINKGYFYTIKKRNNE